MAKQNLKKILDGEILGANELTAEEKKCLYDVMKEHGMSNSTTYLRFFSKGFSQWELLGVAKLRDEFLQTTPCCVDDKGTEDPGSRGYGYVLTLAQDYDDSKFYDMVTALKMGVKLCEFMASRGMASTTTVRTRFRSNNWKPWEIKGVASILKTLLSE